MNGLAEDLTGLVGSRALVFFAERFYSPVYGHMEWRPGRVTEEASCAIGCGSVPSERHTGCGFHAHWQVQETLQFVEQIRGTADCVVLVECFGRTVVHEKGFRTLKARITAVVDWDPRMVFFTYLSSSVYPHPSVPEIASRYFGVPTIPQRDAQSLINVQRAALGQYGA